MKSIRRHLGWKLFFSYLIIILVGAVSLAIVAEFVTPNAFNRHMAGMELMMGGSMGGMMGDLTESFQRAVNEILLVAATLAIDHGRFCQHVRHPSHCKACQGNARSQPLYCQRPL